jgi:hypothetical protein
VSKGLLPYISNDPLLDRDIGKRFGFWEPALAKDVKRRIFYEFFRRAEDEKILRNVINYFNAVKNRWPKAWGQTGTGNVINRTTGFNGFARFLRPAYSHWTTEPGVVTVGQFSQIFKNIKLDDGSFNPNEFLPGGSGASKLYRILIEQSGVKP